MKYLLALAAILSTAALVSHYLTRGDVIMIPKVPHR